MKLVQVKCENCGATMMVPEDSTSVKCEYCDSVFALDDEAAHVKFDNAKQAGYEFERGRIRAQKEESARQHAATYGSSSKTDTGRDSRNWDPSQGAPDRDQRSWFVLKLVITLLFGIFGAHKFMEGRIGMGFIYLFTFGIFGIGYAIDVIMEIAQLIRMYSY